jgi:TorA maturation chaperone TorD
VIAGTAAAARRELLRALGAVASSPPPFCHPAAAALGLAEPTPAEHTAVFVLSAPPHAAIYLGAEGKLGGEALDRVAGFWRVLQLTPPPDADHLGALLILYAEIGDAEAAAHSERTREQLRHARQALLWEHLWSWAPGYLTAVSSLAAPSLSRWAQLSLRALSREARQAAAPASLPLALRSAPAALRADHHAGASMVRDSDGGRLLDAVLTPARSGLIVTRDDLRDAAKRAGVGYRLGERRYALQAMLGQDTAATLGWLSSFATQWADKHARQQPVNGADPRHWWAGRAQHTAATLSKLQRQLVAAG